jgi:hypothetical protein
MANFLITKPNTSSTGGAGNDSFVLQTAGVLGSTVFAGDGNDLISAAENGVGTNIKFNGQQGDDTIVLRAGLAASVGKVYGGGGNDLISAGSAALIQVGSIVNGGGGADTIQLASAVAISASTINGNGGKDLISAGQLTAYNTFLGLGGGSDSLYFGSAIFSTSTIAAGGGADLISATYISGDRIRIEGDTVGDTEFYGNDTIRIVGGTVGRSALVQGGGGADVISLTASYLSGSTINGNAGKDKINLLSAGGASAFGIVGGGAGADTITISAIITTGNNSTIFGGGQADVISVSAVASGAGLQIVGGEGSDTIGLGGTVTGGATSVNVRYTSFGDSTLGSIDYVSASVSVESAYVISQSVVSGSTAISVNAGGADGVVTNANGTVTSFGNNVAGDVTARTTVLDTYLSKGQVATFTDGAGNDYLFIQAGAAGNGTADDLLVSTNSLVTGISIAGGTAITISQT